MKNTVCIAIIIVQFAALTAIGALLALSSRNTVNDNKNIILGNGEDVRIYDEKKNLRVLMSYSPAGGLRSVSISDKVGNRSIVYNFDDKRVSGYQYNDDDYHVTANILPDKDTLVRREEKAGERTVLYGLSKDGKVTIDRCERNSGTSVLDIPSVIERTGRH